MFHTSSIEISRSALKKNLEYLRKEIGEGVRFSSVVKGNAYGHGIELYVPLAEEFGIDHFSVFSANEALRVTKVGNGQSQIMIMGMLDNEELEWAIMNGIEFFVFEMDRLEKALEISKKTGTPAKVHIEVETGMNRTGFESGELTKVLKMMKNEPFHLSMEGLCTHFAGAESIANYYRLKKQFAQYNRLKKRFAKHDLIPKSYHTACSAAAMRYPKSRLDLVRVGILQYGFFPSREVLIEHLTKKKIKDYPLSRLISWKTKVMDIKRVKTGDFIGYGTSYFANSDMIVASVPVGYGHGFSRSLSNQGRVLIRGSRAGVVGTVNMNMVLVDVSNIEGVKKGDEVVLIGRQGELELSVSSFSEFSELVNYELLTRLPADIPRRIVE